VKPTRKEQRSRIKMRTMRRIKNHLLSSKVEGMEIKESLIITAKRGLKTIIQTKRRM